MAEEKLAIVMEGLKEKRSVADICREHKISQTLYYRWRDKFLEAKLNDRGMVFFVFCEMQLPMLKMLLGLRLSHNQEYYYFNILFLS